MAERDRPHLVVSDGGASEPFTLASSGGGSDAEGFSGDRGAHGRRLKRELEQALSTPADDVDREGTYVAFVSFPGLELALESLDPRATGEHPELVSVREETNASGLVHPGWEEAVLPGPVVALCRHGIGRPGKACGAR